MLTPDSSTAHITAGPDGNLWFTEHGTTSTPVGKIGRITTSGDITEFQLTTDDCFPYAITAGPDGYLWFTEYRGNKIGRITTSGDIKEFQIPTSNSYPSSIVAGPDGALWFTEGLGNKIGRITTNGDFTGEFTVPTANSWPQGITTGPDGNLWFTELNGNKIGRIKPNGEFNGEFNVRTDSNPRSITSGPDGNIWFTEDVGNNVGRITMNGTVTEFPIQTPNTTLGNGYGPHGITTGSDGNLWFAEAGNNKISKITTGGVITRYDSPTCPEFNGGGPHGIATGSDGNIWFAHVNCNYIGRLNMVHDLSMSMTGTGSGTVTASPGYNCSGTCRQEYDSGITVTLNAAEAVDSTFSGWTGCDAANDTACTVSMTSARSITANFTRLSPGTGTVYGRITDSSGTGVSNAMVRMIQEYNSSACSSPSCMNIFTDSLGNYLIGNLVPGTYVEQFYNQPVPFGTSGNYLITTNQWYSKKHTMASADLISVNEGSAIELDAVYPPFGQVSGMVSDTNGTGMANVAVRVYDLDEQATDAGWTDAAGNYTVQHLPSGTYKLRFVANNAIGPLPAQNLVTQVAYVTVAAPGTVTGINATMNPGRSISGRITNMDGLPVAANAIVIGPNGQNIASAPTNTTGVYTAIGIPAGSYKVLFRAAPTSSGGTIDATQLYSRCFYGGSADLDNASVVTVTADADVSNIDGVLQVSGPAIVSSGPAVLTAFVKDFGVEVVGMSSYRSVTLANSGTADLTLGALSKTGDDFLILNDRCSGVTLAPTKICTFQVAFIPLSEGAKTGSVSIPSNDPDIPLFNVSLMGSGGAAMGNSGTTSVMYGDNVTAAPTTDVNLSFSSVTSAEGTVTATAITTLASPVPSNFRLLNGTSYDITTTATFTGTVTVCIIYDEATMSNPANEQNLRLFHYSGGSWQDITTLVDTVANKICGKTETLSPFAVAEPVSAEQLIDSLVKTVNSLDLKQGITTSLDAKLQAAVAALDAARANDRATACNQMNGFINEVSAQSGKMITAEQANQLITASLTINAALGCP